MGVQTIAYLAPEIPSVSGTFVYREIRALEACGNGAHVTVQPFTLRTVQDGDQVGEACVFVVVADE